MDPHLSPSIQSHQEAATTPLLLHALQPPGYQSASLALLSSLTLPKQRSSVTSPVVVHQTHRRVVVLVDPRRGGKGNGAVVRDDPDESSPSMDPFALATGPSSRLHHMRRVYVGEPQIFRLEDVTLAS